MQGQSIIQEFTAGHESGSTMHSGMDFVIHLVAKIVVPLFLVGMAGSAFVIVATFIEDLKDLLNDEE
jgi:hypothetical protein